MTNQLTFLFTDIEGSTRIWEQQTAAMQSALEKHDAILIDAVEAHRGQVVKTTGDGLHAVFESANDGVSAALTGQFNLYKEKWPTEIGNMLVRMGLHTGESQNRDGDYYGPTLNRGARIMSIGHGGQILLSNQTALLVQPALPETANLINLGEHSLRDLTSPETIHQLAHPDLPEKSQPLSSLNTFKHNFPTQLSEFIGRENELNKVTSLLNDTRLLTLLGPGGTGKSRLALQAAANLLDKFPDGAWLIELAPISDPALLLERVASVFNIQGQSARPLNDIIKNYLRRKKMLLILDNVEHLIRESAELTNQLLIGCPEIKILVTGRESLYIPGETTLQVPSLSLPSEEDQDLTTATTSEAVQFFLTLAQEIHPGFALTTQNLTPIVQIVRRLDGIPLALELAAARLRVLSIEQIATRLNDRFRLLTGGKRAVLPRQQTLQALIDWSWNLLDETEQIILQRLSIFSGGWTLAAAQAVVSDEKINEYEIIDGMEQLINKSMVTAQHLPNDNLRYRMLESIHQYSRDRLLEAEESEIFRQRHAEFFTKFSEEASKWVEGSEMMTWVELVLNEKDNANTAREWAHDNRLDLALKMTGASVVILRYWYFTPEGQRWLSKVVEKGRASNQIDQNDELEKGLACAITALGTALVFRGDYKSGQILLEEGIQLSSNTGLMETQIFGVSMLTVALQNLGELDQSISMAEDALALYDINDFDFHKQVILGTLARTFAIQGDYEQAKIYANENIELAEISGNPWLKSTAYFSMGRLEKNNENFKTAED
jgi:predicted ATPase/class 3 adenylate cyclase